ncbi:FecR domain-containing protein [Candidatus Peregrinibacteria bacterium]|nr:FecR domain-containing protein [Candidatus Peregrinibacteria bacterium]
MKFFKKLFLGIFSIALVAGTFFLDERLATVKGESGPIPVRVIEKGPDADTIFENDAYAFKSGASKRLVIELFENAVLRFAPNTSGALVFQPGDASNRHAELSLAQGRIWVNSFASPLSLVIKTKAVSVTASPGVFDIIYQDGKVDITARRRSAVIGFLGNELVLPEGRSMSISEAKINASASAIAKLRYSKLFKEFPFFAQEKSDDWMRDNARDDEVFLAEFERKRDKSIREAGPHFGSDDISIFSRLGELMKQSAITLTFDPQKKEEREINLVFQYFDAAAYYFLTGNEAAGQKWLFVFQKKSELFRDKPVFQNGLVRRLDQFSIASSAASGASASSRFFDMKLALRDAGDPSVLAKLNFAFEDIEDALAAGSDTETQARVLKLLRLYGGLVDGSIRRVKNSQASTQLFVQYIRFQDFLRRHPEFIREEFLKIGNLYEIAYVDLLETKEQADDERQFFMNEKLKQIQMIRDFMNKEVIPFQDGRRSILALANQIETIKPAFSDTAVASYFDDQIKDLSPFLAFLRSSRAENLRGSFEKDFQEFETNLSDLQKVTALLGAATGGTQISAFRREELAGIVATDLGGIDAVNIKIILPEGEDDPRVKVVSAEFEGKIWSGTYDTSRKVLSDIVFDSQKIPNAIRLENTAKFFLFQMGKAVLPTGVTPESLTEAVSPESLLERAAKTKLLEELKKLDISVEEKYLGLENLNDGVIHVRLALLGEGADAKVFSFDVSQNVSVASRLKVQTVSGEIPVNDEFGLRELPTKVEQIYQRAVFEKQKEEELKKMLNDE